MTASSLTQRALAGIASFGMTSFLLFAYFYVPATHVVPGIVA